MGHDIKDDGPIIIDFKPNNVVKGLEILLEMAKKGEIDNLICAAFNTKDEIVVVKAKLNIIEQQHLVSFLQVDTTQRIIREGVIK